MRRALATLLLAALLAGCSPAVAATPDTQASISNPTSTDLPEPTATATTAAEPSESPALQALENTLELVESGEVSAYPGPLHYAGDVLTFEVPLDEFADAAATTATLSLDGGAPIEVSGSWNFNILLLPLALDTSGLEGDHQVRIHTEGDGPNVNAVYEFSVLPAEERPAQEVGAEWQMAASECCTIHYLSNSAAARDIESIVAASDTAFAQLEDLMGRELDGSLDIWLLDRMWGNGAFGGGGELAATYSDRNYGPAQGEEGLLTLFRHEFTHAAELDTSKTQEAKFYFAEGLAVYLAGGHYKPEPLEARSAAMPVLGYGDGLEERGLVNHEIAYLRRASVVAFVVDAYGWDTFWAFRDAAVFDAWFDEEQREQVLMDVFGIGYQEFSQAYSDWLGSYEPGEQLDDLRLTVELQDLRREYQERFSREPTVIFGRAEESYGVPDYSPIVMREISLPANVTVELMIANGQQAIAAGDYDAAQDLVDAIADVLASGSFTHPLASRYASAVEALAAEGYEVLGLTFDGDSAEVIATQQAPDLVELRLELVDGRWQIGN